MFVLQWGLMTKDGVSERLDSCNKEPPLTASTPLSTVNFPDGKKKKEKEKRIDSFL